MWMCPNLPPSMLGRSLSPTPWEKGFCGKEEQKRCFSQYYFWHSLRLSTSLIKMCHPSIILSQDIFLQILKMTSQTPKGHDVKQLGRHSGQFTSSVQGKEWTKPSIFLVDCSGTAIKTLLCGLAETARSLPARVLLTASRESHVLSGTRLSILSHTSLLF